MQLGSYRWLFLPAPPPPALQCTLSLLFPRRSSLSWAPFVPTLTSIVCRIPICEPFVAFALAATTRVLIKGTLPLDGLAERRAVEESVASKERLRIVQ